MAYRLDLVIRLRPKFYSWLDFRSHSRMRVECDCCHVLDYTRMFAASRQPCTAR